MITSTFYDMVQGCVDEVLRDRVIPLEPIGDILASSYTSISYVVGHDTAAPFEKYIKVFKCSASAWRGFLASSKTP